MLGCFSSMWGYFCLCGVYMFLCENVGLRVITSNTELNVYADSVFKYVHCQNFFGYTSRSVQQWPYP